MIVGKKGGFLLVKENRQLCGGVFPSAAISDAGGPARRRISSGHTRGGAYARAEQSLKQSQPTLLEIALLADYHALSYVLNDTVAP